ncbi:MAG: amino acid adenylation domain-containing protein [Negativicutes bacterium]|jgi:amino acid adenylation domain-containing protein/thioester reductase-like protein
MEDRKTYRLTHAQQRIMYGEKFYPGTGFANCAVAVRIPADLDSDTLARSINAVISGNDALRLQLEQTADGVDRQYIADYSPQSFTVEDFGDEQAKLQEWIKLNNATGFVLYNQPLYRILLARCQSQITMLVVIHHAICDNRTLANFVRQVAENYASIKVGSPTIAGQSYREFLDSETIYLQSVEYQADREFWLAKYAELPEYSCLFGKEKTVADISTERIDYSLPVETARQLQEFCSANKASYFSVFTVVFAIWLARCTGRYDMVLGVPYHNRQAEGSGDSFGHFVSTMPVRLTLTGQSTVRESLAYVRNAIKEAIVHQRYPFDLLLQELKTGHSGTDQMIEYYLVQSSFGKCATGSFPATVVPRPAAPEPMAVFLNQGITDENGLRTIAIEYQTAKYSAAEVDAIYSRLLTVLAAALANPDGEICLLPMVTASEREQLLVDFNDNKMDIPFSRSYHGLFREQVARTPDNLALQFKNESYTYRQLDEKTDSLATVLRANGVGIETIVPIMLERSAEMVIAAIAVMKAGGAYLPLDIKYPQARLDYMLEDSNATIILSQLSLRDKFSNFKGKVFDLQDAANYPAVQCAPADISNGSNLSAIIYTSGTTGLPKGTMITHGGMVNMFYSENQATGLSATDRLGSYASFSFDASMWSNFAPLLAGAAVYIVPAEIMLSLPELNQFYEDNKISLTFMTTQLAEQFAELVENHSLRLLTTGGEKYKTYRQTPYQIVNAYGPTEYTIYTTRFVIDKNYENMPIGKPLANTCVYVLDANLQLQPPGVPGELCIAGAQMARGYRNRPELTAEKFIDNPFHCEWATDNCRYDKLYRTGDLVRWTADGNLEYLARIDQQVKIRGFRIEIGEIEQKIMQYDGVKQAVVIARSDSGGNTYLCGYFAADRAIDIGELQAFMLEGLPDFMIPQTIMQLKDLPLNANGKVDKRALPEPSSTVTNVEYAAPRSDVEKALCDLWQDILGVKQVGINDRFNSLGGTSLKLVVLGAKLQKMFSKTVPVAELAKIPTVKLLAERLANSRSEVGSYEVIPELPEAASYPAASAQKGMFIIDQMADIGNTYHVVQPIVLQGRLNKERLGVALDKMVERHPGLRTTFSVIDGEVRQTIHTGVRLKKTIKAVDEQTVDKAIADFIQQFDLQSAPLLRVALFELSANKHLLVLDAHHIVMDGISVVVFVKELMALYQNQQLPPLTVNYYDYADWYNKKLAQGAFAANAAFWQEQLAGELPVLNLATDFPRAANKKYQGGNVFADLDKSVADKLKALAEARGVSFFALLLAAFNIMLARYSGQDDIVVGSPFANRTHPDIDSIIGMFVNTLPLRTYPQRDKLFGDYLQEVNGILLAAGENQAYPFENIVNDLGITRDASRNPVFDVVFAYFVEEFLFESEDLSLQRYNYDAGVAHFDVLLYVMENKQGLSLFLEYDRNLFKAETADRLIGHYLNLLQVLSDNMECRLGSIDFISETERELLLQGFNANVLPVPLDSSYQRLFREQVARTPDKAALVFKDTVLTYRQLDHKTDILAGCLRQRGVVREAIVPIMLERSAEMIIAAIAVMKAGGAYLPLDIKYPQARLDYMLEDSASALILSQPSLKEKFAEFNGEYIDVTAAALYDCAGAENTNVTDVNQGSDLAAIIYTSGSTGLPKGTMIMHRNIVNMCFSENRDNAVTADDIMASYASFSFDAAMWSNFAPLLAGATVHIVPEEIMLSLVDLNKFIEERRATITFMTTQLCEQFTDLVDNKTLRILATGGEKYKTYRQTNYKVVNGYGPTEYTVYTTRFVIDKNYDNIPIGKPLANARVYVVDKDFQLQPLGAPGELCIAGPQLARGYRNREDLTAEKFIDNPFANDEIYSRMYRTGDLVRWLPDGNLEFLSRIDQQVKIRGFRIEIGEIEQEIMSYQSVNEAVVVARDDAGGNKFLCGYFTADTAIEMEQLQEFMAKDLPGYMIPAFMMQIDVMPLNANGKIDKKALPEAGSTTTAGEFIEPTGEIERKLACVWQEVLGVNAVSATDSFFCIGGNSIKAISAVAKLQKLFTISINDLFNYPVLRTLAENIKPAEDTLKLRLAELSQQEATLDTPLTDNPRFKAVHDASMIEYQRSIEELRGLELGEALDYRNILVTGATGYLGVHIVQYLVANRSGTVYAIVRGRDADDATSRVRAKFDYYFGKEFWNNAHLDERLVVLCGELHQPRLGLSDDLYNRLCTELDAIIHSAANVRHYGHYSEFFEANVQATSELLALAKTGRKKDFHHISTMSVAVGEINGCEYHVFTENQTDIGQKSGNYYVETKLAAEELVVAARQDGLNTNIYRAGNIAFQESTGLYQENIDSNAFYRYMQGFINVGMVPNKLDSEEFSYVDRLAEAIVRLSERPGAHNQIYHMQNPQLMKLSQALTAPCLGLNVRAVSVTEFFDYLYENSERPGFREHVENILTRMGLMGEESTITTATTIKMDKTLMMLEKVGFSWPTFAAGKLQPMVEHALAERVQLLAGNTIFATLERQLLLELAGSSRMLLWKRRSEILWEGQASPVVYLIIHGFAQLLRSSVGGWQGMVGMAKKNEIVGLELASVSDRAILSAEATMGDTLVLALPRDLLREYGETNPQLLLGMLKVMNDRVDKLSRLVVSLG